MAIHGGIHLIIQMNINQRKKHCHNKITPDSKVHGADMGPIWGRQDPGGPHIGPMNFAIWDFIQSNESNHWHLSLWFDDWLGFNIYAGLPSLQPKLHQTVISDGKIRHSAWMGLLENNHHWELFYGKLLPFLIKQLPSDQTGYFTTYVWEFIKTPIQLHWVKNWGFMLSSVETTLFVTEENKILCLNFDNYVRFRANRDHFISKSLQVQCCLYETGPIQWMFSQHCGYWWPGALAPGHQ